MNKHYGFIAPRLPENDRHSDYRARAADSYHRSVVFDCWSRRGLWLPGRDGLVQYFTAGDETDGPGAQHSGRHHRHRAFLSWRLFFLANLLALRAHLDSGFVYRRRPYPTGAD